MDEKDSGRADEKEAECGDEKAGLPLDEREGQTGFKVSNEQRPSA
jgi:hypothetical protein